MRETPVESTDETLGAIIVAAGRGARMGGVDKLFAPLAGQPVLAHTLRAFEDCPAAGRIVLVMSAENIDRGRNLVREGGFRKVTAVCAGGARRQDSVRMGLEALGPCDFVAVHDGGRPLVTPDLIERGLEAARETGAAVPAVPLADTVKEAAPDGTVLRTLDRSRLRAVQTPQVFRHGLLVRAHREVTADPSAGLRAGYTDDAAMLEALGVRVKLFEGARCNIKITTHEDLEIVRAMVETQPGG